MTESKVKGRDFSTEEEGVQVGRGVRSFLVGRVYCFPLLSQSQSQSTNGRESQR